jgi:hypothetical protein
MVKANKYQQMAQIKNQVGVMLKVMLGLNVALQYMYFAENERYRKT